jgi:membrane-associated phospholipid phosphatase
MLALGTPLWLHRGEPALFVAINQACMLLPAPVWTGLSLLGNTWGVLAATSPLLVLAPRLLWAWLCAVPFGVLFARLGKGLLESPRPAAVVDNSLFRLVGEKLEVASMPSGHTLTAFAVASSLYFALDARDRSRFAWLWLLAAAVGLSRIAVGAHWPGDVAVGAGLGVLAGMLGNLLWRRLGPAYGRPQDWRLHGVAMVLLATVYVLLDAPLDFPQKTFIQRVMAAMVVGVLAVFLSRQRGRRLDH